MLLTREPPFLGRRAVVLRPLPLKTNDRFAKQLKTKKKKKTKRNETIINRLLPKQGKKKKYDEYYQVCQQHNTKNTKQHNIFTKLVFNSSRAFE